MGYYCCYYVLLLPPSPPPGGRGRVGEKESPRRRTGTPGPPRNDVYSQLLQARLVHHDFHTRDLVIHLLLLPLLFREHVCEYERRHLRSSPRGPASQTTIPHSCSHRRSHNRHLTQSESAGDARTRALVLFRLRAHLGGVGGAADDGYYYHHRCCVAVRPAEQQRVIHSRRYRLRCCFHYRLHHPHPLSQEGSSGSRQVTLACSQRARRRQRLRDAQHHHPLRPRKKHVRT